MKVKPNIGIFNALIRITIGLTILAWSTSKMVKHPWRDSYLFMAILRGDESCGGNCSFLPGNCII